MEATTKVGHSAGPWRAIPGAADYRPIGCPTGALARVYREADSFFADPVGEANARLIAAAPTLLRVLTMIESGDWPGLIAFARERDCLPTGHGADDPSEYEWKGDHHDDARYTAPARARIIGACCRAVIAAATTGE